MSLPSQRPSLVPRENRKQLFDANYIADWLNTSFPVLSVTPEHITKPTSDDICDIYMVLTQHILSLPTAALTTPPFDALGGDVDVEMFSRATPKLVIFKSLSALIEDLTDGQSVLTLSDLLKPNARSTRRLLSVLIDYIQFTQRITPEINRIFTMHSNKKADLEKRRAEVEELERKVAELRVQHERRKGEENQKRAELEQNSQKTREVVEENRVLQAKHQAIVSELSEKSKRIDELDGEMRSLEMHNEMLTAKLVTSPERLETEVREASDRKEIVLQEYTAKRRELNEEQDKKQHRLLVSSALNEAKDYLKQFPAFEEKIKAINERVADRERERNKKLDELESQQNAVAKQRDAINECDTAFEREREKHANQLSNYTEQIGTVQSQVEDMRRRLDVFNKDNIEVQREIGKVKDDLSTLNRKAEADSVKMARRLKGVLDKLNQSRQVYDEEYRVCEELVDMVNESRHMDGPENSDSIRMVSKK